jgi:hypothetical protein
MFGMSAAVLLPIFLATDAPPAAHGSRVDSFEWKNRDSSLTPRWAHDQAVHFLWEAIGSHRRTCLPEMDAVVGSGLRVSSYSQQFT